MWLGWRRENERFGVEIMAGAKMLLESSLLMTLNLFGPAPALQFNLGQLMLHENEDQNDEQDDDDVRLE